MKILPYKICSQQQFLNMWEYVIILAFFGHMTSIQSSDVESLPTWYRLLYKNCPLANNKWYNPATEICCGSRLYKRSDSFIFCCSGGNEIYDIREAFCCGDRVVTRKKSGSKLTCCGGALVNESEGHCCHDNWVKHTHRERVSNCSNTQCCGVSRTYNPQSERCCFSEDNYYSVRVIPKLPNLDCCNLVTFDPTTHMCVHGKIREIAKQYTADCGGNVYDTRTQSCCNGVLHGANKVCCDGTLHDIAARMTCCGSVYMARSTHVCCNRVVYRKSRGVCCNHTWNVIIDATPSQRSCCGHKLITGRQRCCNGRILADTEGQCCRTRTLQHHELCCDGQYIVAKMQATHNKCCVSVHRDRYITYDNAIEMCTGLGLIPTNRPNNIKRCGHDEDADYNMMIDSCCGGIITKGIPQAQAKCCRGKAYHQTHVSPCDLFFCGDNLYSADHICCGGQPYLKAIHGNHCCAGVPYKRANQKCCLGKLQARGSRCRAVCRQFCRRQRSKQLMSFLCRQKYVFTAHVTSVKAKRHKTVLKLRNIQDVHRHETFPSHANTTTVALTAFFKGQCQKCRRNLLNKDVIVLTSTTPQSKLRLSNSDLISLIKNTTILTRIQNYPYSKCNVFPQ